MWQGQKCCAETGDPSKVWIDRHDCKARTQRNCMAYRGATACSSAPDGCVWQRENCLPDDSGKYTPCWMIDLQNYCESQSDCRWSDKHETCYNKAHYAKQVKCPAGVKRTNQVVPFVRDATRPSDIGGIRTAWQRYYAASGQPGRGVENRVTENIETCKKLMSNDEIKMLDKDVGIWCGTRYARKAACRSATPARHAQFCTKWQRNGWRLE